MFTQEAALLVQATFHIVYFFPKHIPRALYHQIIINKRKFGPLSLNNNNKFIFWPTNIINSLSRVIKYPSKLHPPQKKKNHLWRSSSSFIEIFRHVGHVRAAGARQDDQKEQLQSEVQPLEPVLEGEGQFWRSQIWT